MLAKADLPMLIAGLSLIAGSLLGLLALLVRRRRAAEGTRPGDGFEPPAEAFAGDEGDEGAEEGVAVLSLADLLPALDDAAPAAEDLHPAGLERVAHDPADVRALRAQVRCLEEALSRAAATATEAAAAEVLASYRTQVRALVRSVAIANGPGVDPHGVLDRVLAGLDRLDQPGGLTRPTLPGRRTAGPTVLAASVTTAAPVAVGRPAALTMPVTEQVTGPLTEPVTGPVAEPARPVTVLDDEVEAVASDAAPQHPEPVDEERVVPVPPPATPEPRRHRRRLRHSAA
jgi:hypothetical protein